MTDHDRDVVRAQRAVAEQLATAPDNVDSHTRAAYACLQRASLTGRPADFASAEGVLDRALGKVGAWPDLCLLKAELDLRFHRLAETRRDLEMAPGLLDCTQGRALLADVLLQEGDYDDARSIYQELVTQERTWDHLARLAHMAACTGDLELADSLYVAAEDEITAKTMRSFAWVKLQRGLLHVHLGRPDRAWPHYQNAERAYGGSWRTTEHIAQLLALEGRVQAAIELYESVLERTERPELGQPLADLYTRVGEHGRARRSRDRALTAFLASAHAGEVHYLHHLAELGPGPTFTAEDAVAWARQDHALRPNYLTRSTLACALGRAGLTGQADHEMASALATGMRDPRLLSRAEAFHANAAPQAASPLGS